MLEGKNLSSYAAAAVFFLVIGFTVGFTVSSGPDKGLYYQDYNYSKIGEFAGAVALYDEGVKVCRTVNSTSVNQFSSDRDECLRQARLMPTS